MAGSLAGSLAKAEAIAKARGAAFTPIRRRVLSLILKARRPIGAYELLAALKDARETAIEGTFGTQHELENEAGEPGFWIPYDDWQIVSALIAKAEAQQAAESVQRREF